MQNTGSGARYQPLLLRRLTDFYPHEKKDNSAGVTIEKQLKDDVVENITVLFNSRSHPSLSELKGNEEVQNSVLGFGLSDYCGNMRIKSNSEELRQEVLKQLRQFEPRLAPESITVEFVKTKVKSEALIEFQISAMIDTGEVNKEILLLVRLDVETGSTELLSLMD
jgi:type VI secretion system lysozyme-like protein